MSDAQYEQLTWQETKNGITIDCSLDIAVHPAKSNVIFVTIPGVDGSVDGYENKYVDIANSVQHAHGVAVVRASNPFITSFHWKSNVRQLLAYISDNAERISGSDSPELYIMAHSAGAAIIAQIAHEYQEIKRLLLINTATKLGIDQILDGLKRLQSKRTIVVYGELDPGAVDYSKFSKLPNLKVALEPNTDHNFSGEAKQKFINLPTQLLF